MGVCTKTLLQAFTPQSSFVKMKQQKVHRYTYFRPPEGVEGVSVLDLSTCSPISISSSSSSSRSRSCSISSSSVSLGPLTSAGASPPLICHSMSLLKAPSGLDVSSWYVPSSATWPSELMQMMRSARLMVDRRWAMLIVVRRSSRSLPRAWLTRVSDSASRAPSFCQLQAIICRHMRCVLTGSFIENKNVGLLDEGTSDCYALFLATRKLSAPGTNMRLQTVGLGHVSHDTK